MTANERRKMLLERLCVRRHETRENFAAEFGVSLRTIERDVVWLMTEYPVITTQGYGGGIGVEDWYICVNGEEIVCTGGHPFYVLNIA